MVCILCNTVNRSMHMNKLLLSCKLRLHVRTAEQKETLVFLYGSRVCGHWYTLFYSSSITSVSCHNNLGQYDFANPTLTVQTSSDVFVGVVGNVLEQDVHEWHYIATDYLITEKPLEFLIALLKYRRKSLTASPCKLRVCRIMNDVTM